MKQSYKNITVNQSENNNQKATNKTKKEATNNNNQIGLGHKSIQNNKDINTSGRNKHIILQTNYIRNHNSKEIKHNNSTGLESILNQNNKVENNNNTWGGNYHTTSSSINISDHPCQSKNGNNKYNNNNSNEFKSNNTNMHQSINHSKAIPHNENTTQNGIVYKREDTTQNTINDNKNK